MTINRSLCLGIYFCARKGQWQQIEFKLNDSHTHRPSSCQPTQTLRYPRLPWTEAAVTAITITPSLVTAILLIIIIITTIITNTNNSSSSSSSTANQQPLWQPAQHCYHYQTTRARQIVYMLVGIHR